MLHSVGSGIDEIGATWVASMRWKAMPALDHLDKVGTGHEVPRFGPSRWR
jgi:hypothetical protein